MERIACGPKRVPGRCEVPPSNGAPEDDDVGVGVGRRVVEVAGGHAEEGDVGTELSAVASHAPTLGLDPGPAYQSPSAANLSPMSRWVAESGWRWSGSGSRSASAGP